MNAVYGESYGLSECSSCSLYPASGSSGDWAASPDHGNAVVAATVELRDKGKEGFLLSPQYIQVNIFN